MPKDAFVLVSYFSSKQLWMRVAIVDACEAVLACALCKRATREDTLVRRRSERRWWTRRSRASRRASMSWTTRIDTIDVLLAEQVEWKRRMDTRTCACGRDA